MNGPRSKLLVLVVLAAALVSNAVLNFAALESNRETMRLLFELRDRLRDQRDGKPWLPDPPAHR